MRTVSRGGTEPIHSGKLYYYHTPSQVLDGLYVLYGEQYRLLAPFLLKLLLYFVLLVVLCVVGGYVAFIVTKRMYQPIQNILTTIDRDDANDDLAAIRDSIHGLKETNVSLRQEIDEERSLLRNKFLSDCVLGLIGNEDMARYARRYAIHLSKEGGYLVLVEPYFVEGTDFGAGLYADAHGSIYSLVREYLASYSACIGIRLGENRFLFMAEGTTAAELRQNLNSILSLVESDYGRKYIAAMVPMAGELSLLAGEYAKLKRILERRVFGDGRIIYDESDLDAHKNTFYYPIEAERDLMACVLDGNWEGCSRLLDGLIEENLTARTLPREEVSEWIYVVVVMVKRILQKMNVSSADVFADGDFSYVALKMYTSAGQLSDSLRDMFHTLCGYVSDRTENTAGRAAVEMCEYVKQNYGRDLSLNDMAEHFNLSVNYISRAFKKYTGDNFKDYLNRYRVEVADELMRSGDITVNEVAQRVGCNSATSFIRIYKRYRGEAPGKWLKK